MERPEIKKQDGATTIDVVVNLNHGVIARSSVRLVEECKTFAEGAYKAYLVNPSGAEYDCKSSLEILLARPVKGAKFTIKVLGEDKLAEQLALRIYSALTSENSFSMDFYRFENG